MEQERRKCQMIFKWLMVAMVMISITAKLGFGIEDVYAVVDITGLWEYTQNIDGNVVINGYLGSETELVIPNQIDGHYVVTIGENAFYQRTELRTVEIPLGVKYILKNAFYGCSNLSTLILPKYMETIGDWAFTACVSLSTVSIPNTVTSIGDFAFVSCKGLKAVAIYDGTTIATGNTFAGCPELTIYSPIDSCAQTYAIEKGINWKKLEAFLFVGGNVTLSNTSYTYDGTEKKPTVTVEFGDYKLVNGVDYKIVYSQNINAGMAKMDLVGIGEFDGEVLSINFIINPDKMSISFKKDVYIYNGLEHRPNVSVQNDAGTVNLQKGTDYEVTYSDNINVGTASVTITGIGNYEGSLSTTFTIEPMDITDVAEITYPYGTTKVYNRLKQKLFVGLRIGNIELEHGVDYGLNYGENINAGIGTIEIYGSGNYTGYLTTEFVIEPAMLPPVTLEDVQHIYLGSEITPALTVKEDDWLFELEEGVDYTLSYVDNINAGTGKVIVTGIGNYTGEVIKGFTISPREIINLKLLNNAFDYTGNGIIPEIVVTSDCWNLVKDQDYIVTYSNNINVGTATVSVTGIGNYEGTLTDEFTISPATITEASLTSETCTYTGSALQPKLTVKCGEKELTAGTDYTATYEENINVGTAKVNIQGIGNYKGTLTKTFTIVPATITDVTLDKNSFTYDGTEKIPVVKVKNNDIELAKGTDYTITYAANVEIGTATVTVDGIGNYTGTVTKEFVIEASQLTEVTLSTESYMYDGTEKKPEVTVKSGKVALTNGEHYTVTYSGNVNAGTATVTVTGIGNYAGTMQKEFVILPKEITAITLAVESYNYDGTEKQPEVTVKCGDSALVKDTDYTVSYSANINAGTATVTVTGCGNYTGVLMKEFTITPVEITEVIVKKTTCVYDGLQKKTEVVVKCGEKELVLGVDYGVEFGENIHVGIATVAVTGIGNYKGRIEKTYEITPATFTEVVLSENTFVYDGLEKCPAVQVKNDVLELVKDKDYTVQYAANVNAGTAVVTITGVGNYTGVFTKEFKITPKSITEATLLTETYVYDGIAKQPEVQVQSGIVALINGTDYTLTYHNNVNAGTAEVIISGIGNYTGTLNKTYNITPAQITEVLLSEESYNYDGTEKQPEVTVNCGTQVLVNAVDYNIIYQSNVNAGTASVVVTGIGNYAGSITKTFIINPAKITEIQLREKNYIYDGTEKQPVVIVKSGEAELTNGIDYELVYTNNVNAGIGSVTVVGLGNYTGSMTDTFSITQAVLTEVLLSQNIYVYDGTEKKPNLTVKCGETTLVQGTDYDVVYKNNVNAGTATVTITATGKYQGAMTKTFVIKPISISTGKLSLANSKYSYDGKAKTPAVTVKRGTAVLKKNKDYTVTYTKNVSIGTATVTVKGIGNYNGSLKKTFNIIPKQVTGLKQSTIKTTSVISLSWNKVASASGYEIYRATSKNGTYVRVKYQSAAAYKNTGVKAGAQYYYKVRAYKTINKTKVYGSYSQVITGITLPKAPSLKVSADTSAIKITWNKVSECKGYELYMATSKNGTYKKITSAKSNIFSYKKTGLSTGKVYYFKARSYYVNPSGKKIYSEYSKIVGGMKIPKAPSLKATTKSDSVKITWNKIAGCVGYEIYMSETENGTYKKIAATSANVVSYNKTALRSNKTYYFKIRSFVKDSSGNKKYSAYSAVKAATTKQENLLVGEWTIDVGTTTQLNNKDLYAQFGSDIKYGYGMTFKENMTFDYFIAKEYGGTGDYKLNGNQIVYTLQLTQGGTESGVLQYSQDDGTIMMDLYGYKIKWYKIG